MDKLRAINDLERSCYKQLQAGSGNQSGIPMTWQFISTSKRNWKLKDLLVKARFGLVLSQCMFHLGQNKNMHFVALSYVHRIYFHKPLSRVYIPPDPGGIGISGWLVDAPAVGPLPVDTEGNGVVDPRVVVVPSDGPGVWGGVASPEIGKKVKHLNHHKIKLFQIFK